VRQERYGLAGNPLFIETIRVFEDLGLQYWLDQGTLLGLVREGRLLKCDHDIDLGMWEEDYRRMKNKIKRELKPAGAFVETFKPHQLSISALDRKHRMVNIAFYRREEGLARKKVPCASGGKLKALLLKVALFCAHARAGTLKEKMGRKNKSGAAGKLFLKTAQMVPGALWQLAGNLCGRFLYLKKGYVQMAVPEEYFLELEEIRAEGLVLPVPAKPEEYLRLKYGDDWHEQKLDWDFTRDDGAIQNRT